MPRTVLISFLGTTLDQGKAEKRWSLWRPSVAICEHESLAIDEYHMIHGTGSAELASRVIADIAKVSPRTVVIPHIVELQDPWDFEEVYSSLLDFSGTLSIDPEKSEYLVHITTGTHVAQICLFLLTESRYFPGKLIQTAPARGDKKSRAGEYSIIDLDLSRYDKIAMRYKQKWTDDISFLKSGIKTKNARFNALIERIEKVAIRTTDPMLLTGPTGAGKSLLAKRIFELKKQHGKLEGPFVEVNCATIRGDGAMSALFGHKKGSFTGAVNERPGLLVTADRGILFLDEIGELGADEQAMLLRAIEEKRFLPLGSDRESESDFQLICGTNRNLREQAANGRFREDLLSRINLWQFSLPGLRERPEDIEPNLEYELSRYMEKHGTFVRFSREAREEFLRFSVSEEATWQSNFRDLGGAVTRMATLAPGGRITIEVARNEIAHLRAEWSGTGCGEDASAESLLVRFIGKERYDGLDRFDRGQLAEVIRVCCESKSLSQAGRLLFSVSRKGKDKPNDADRLRKYLARFGLSWKELGR